MRLLMGFNYGDWPSLASTTPGVNLIFLRIVGEFLWGKISENTS